MKAVHVFHTVRGCGTPRTGQERPFVGKHEVIGRIFHELGPGESPGALDQDVDNYID